MIKRINAMMIVTLISLFLSACTNPLTADRPQLNTIKNICELETLTVKCNDVIVGEKKAGKGWKHVLEKDRVFWVEYVGVVEMGVDADKIKIKVNNDKVHIALPKAEVLDVHIEEGSIDKDSIYVSNDRFINPNEFDADDQTRIIKKAQKQLKTTFEKDDEIKAETTQATKIAIDNYVDKLGESFDVNYEIIWE